MDQTVARDTATIELPEWHGRVGSHYTLLKVFSILGQEKPLHVLWDKSSSDQESNCLFYLWEMCDSLGLKLDKNKVKRACSTGVLRAPNARIVITKKQHAPLLDLLFTSGVLVGAKTNTATLLTLRGACNFLTTVAKKGELANSIREKLSVCVAQWQLEHPSTPQQSSGATGNASPSTPTNCNAGGTPRPSAAYTLREDEIGAGLAEQLAACKAWWVDANQPTRKWDKAVNEASYTECKHMAFLRFLGFCKNHLGLDPCLQLYLDWGIFQKFMSFLDQRAQSSTRKSAKHGEANPNYKITCANAAIAAVKFLKREVSTRRKFWDVEMIETYNVFHQQQKEYSMTHYPEDDKDAIQTWVELPELKRAWESLKEEAMTPLAEGASEKEQLQHAQIWQKYTLMSLWLGLPPMRSGIMRTLHVLDKPPVPGPKCPNAIYWDEKKGTYIMFTPIHKNSRRKKKHMLHLALPTDLFAPTIKTYLDHHRPKLLALQRTGASSCPRCHFTTQDPCYQCEASGQTCTLFLNHLGEAFSKSQFSHWVPTIWAEWTESGTQMQAKLLRDIVVTDLGIRGVPEAIWESYGFMMGHSRETQARTYDRRNQTQRSCLALEDIAAAREDDGCINFTIDMTSGHPTTEQELIVAAVGRHSKEAQKQKQKEAPSSTWQVEKVLNVRPPHGVAPAATKNLKRKWDVLVGWKPTWEPYGHLLDKKFKRDADKMVSEALKRSHSL